MDPGNSTIKILSNILFSSDRDTLYHLVEVLWGKIRNDDSNIDVVKH